MQGQMQDWPLLVHKIIDHAALYHGPREVITRSSEGPIHRTNYARIARRAKRVAHALQQFGIGSGDRVATLGSNTWRHLEAWYGITGTGGVYHTLNPRLFVDQMVYITNHAEDRVMFFDPQFASLVGAIAPRLRTVERYIAFADDAPAEFPDAIAYEKFIAAADEDFVWKDVDER